MNTHGGARNNKAVIWNDKEYGSIKEAAEDHKVSPCCIIYKIEKGKPLKGHFPDYKL